MLDCIAGGIVGLVQIIIGHPLDTIKVLIQNKQKWKNLPLKKYYSGCKYPFISSFIFNATVFPVYERTLDYTNSHYLSGVLGGIMISPVMQVFDLAKVKNQTNNEFNFKILLKNKGIYMSYVRETVALAIYFGSYNYFKSKDYSPFIAGGYAGICNWAFTYPIDVIRSRQLAQNITILEAYKYGNLWKGFAPCMLRAFIVNSSSFYIYEYLKIKWDI